MTRKIPGFSTEVAFKKKYFQNNETLDSIDETPEFYDPYSELNLFLSQKIKKEIHHCSSSKTWSTHLQNFLLNKIIPEFQQRFPRHRLGSAALKKTWEKVQYYSFQIQKQKNAFTPEGKLNISFLIKENLKTASKLQNTCHLHPCHYAHQLAVKMSECIAVMDGIRPKLEQLTRTIWSLQRHLIPNLSVEHCKSPYDETEKIDKLIAKSILQITAKHPEMPQAELVFHVHKQLLQLRLVVHSYNSTQIRKMLEALLADYCHVPSQRMEKTLEQIPYSVAKCLKSELASILLDSPTILLEHAVLEAASFFEKVRTVFLEITDEELERKIQNWTIQGDMFLRWICFNPSSKLFKEVETLWEQKEDLHVIKNEAQKKFLKENAHLISFAKEIETHVWIFLKYLWYTRKFKEETPTYERLLQWHKTMLRPHQLSFCQLLEKVEKICKKTIPLIPFNRARTYEVMLKEEEKEKA